MSSLSAGDHNAARSTVRRIYVLAVALAWRRAGARTFTQRAPWLIADSFGLLHGLGFAGG